MRIPSRRTGFFATLRAFLGRPGSGAPSSTPYRRRRVLAALAVAATLVAVATPALGSGSEPRFEPGALQHEAYSTRLRVSAVIVLVESIETTWQAEYATSASGPWTVVNTGTVHEHGQIGVEIGTLANPNSPPYLRHLTPNIVYYVRFQAQNANGKAMETIELKTLPVAKPEIAKDLGSLHFPPEGTNTFEAGATGPHSAAATARIESNGAQTKYEFAYSTSESGLWTPCATGAVTVAADFAFPKVDCTGLKPETHYFVRVAATNEKGGVSEIKQVTTETAKPVLNGPPSVRNVTATSAYLTGIVNPQGSETHWRFEYETSLSKLEGGEGLEGSEGTVSQEHAGVEDRLTGLSPATVYYVRLSAKNTCAEGCGSTTGAVESFQTAGPPTLTTFAVHAIHGESLRLLAVVNPHSVPTSEEQTITIEGSPTGGTFKLTFKGQTTGDLPYNASAETVQHALQNLPGEPKLSVEGAAGGPYTISWGGSDGEKDQPQIEADASGLTPSGSSITVASTQQGGEAYDTHYHFEYTTTDFTGCGTPANPSCLTTPSVDLGSGDTFQGVGADLPGLKAGETYRYRVVASNTSPGNPVVDGSERTLRVPNVTVEPQPSCGNERFRTGLSGHLPDCRAYEQISPVDKEGAQEALKYSITIGEGTVPGEDGNHFMYMSKSTRWGSGQAPYLFSREEGKGWRMTAGSPQPGTGFNTYVPQVFNPGLTQFGFSSQWHTGVSDETGVSSAEVEFKTGPPGGPYTTVAAVPRKQVPHTEEGWVAASEDFSKLILGVEDHALPGGHNTGTKQGTDLYEYSGGVLRQANVDSEGHTIGSCGAGMVKGDEASSSNRPASAHALSADGSRVFFEAAPGSNCEESHLYMREAAANRTLDIGAYRFAGANMQGSELLLEKRSGETREFFLYHTESASLKPIFSLPTQQGVAVSRDFTAIFLSSTAQLTGTEAPPIPPRTNMTSIYRYDIPAETLRFVVQAAPLSTRGAVSGRLGYGGVGEPSPDGRFLDFLSSQVAGLPGGGPELHEGGTEGPAPSVQLYRYDSADNVVQCISCASPFDPEPKLSVENEGGARGSEWPVGGQPERTFASADGHYAFFETPSALVPQDVNGEIPPEAGNGNRSERKDGTPSNDVYEWRRDGVDGCARLQGCISLITPGTDGWLVSLLGTAAGGRDVFFYTSSQLLPQDNDTTGDFYDARIGGGMPEPAKPVECEGDACSSPLAAPIDTTPASLAFSGPGNPTPVAAPKPKVKPKAKPCRKGTVRKKGRCVKKPRAKAKKGRAKQAARLAGKHNRGGHR
jgi:hypothetical protein